MSELPRSDNPKPKTAEQGPRTLSRRRFLKNAAKRAAVLGGLGLAAKVIPPILFPPGVPPQDEDNPPPTIPRPEGLPEDVLSEEELKQAQITIYHTPAVKLYLRKSVFDIPLFQDLRKGKQFFKGREKGKFDGLVISLVDSESINWNAINKLPDDARLMWQLVKRHPSEYSEEDWAIIKRDSIIEPSLLEDRPQAIEYLANNSRTTGIFSIASKEEMQDLDRRASTPKWVRDRLIQISQKHEWLDKAYLYLVVGGARQPSPSESYPQPEQFDRHIAEYVVRDNRTTGFTLWHEVSHYQAGTWEMGADDLALEAINKAAQRFKRTGNSSGYPFIFKTPEGLTFTKKREAQTTSVQSA